MDCAPNVNIFRELQVVHDTGYFSSQVSPEEDWQQVCETIILILQKKFFGPESQQQRLAKNDILQCWACWISDICLAILYWRVVVFLVKFCRAAISILREGFFLLSKLEIDNVILLLVLRSSMILMEVMQVWNSLTI